MESVFYAKANLYIYIYIYIYVIILTPVVGYGLDQIQHCKLRPFFVCRRSVSWLYIQAKTANISVDGKGVNYNYTTHVTNCYPTACPAH